MYQGRQISVTPSIVKPHMATIPELGDRGRGRGATRGRGRSGMGRGERGRGGVVRERSHSGTGGGYGSDGSYGGGRGGVGVGKKVQKWFDPHNCHNSVPLVVKTKCIFFSSI